MYQIRRSFARVQFLNSECIEKEKSCSSREEEHKESEERIV